MDRNYTGDTDLAMARRVAEEAAASGGRAYFVGGYVRDKILQLNNKDIDIEVHGIAPECLKEILDGLGEALTTGASFGVYKLKGFDLDIAMPRKETATGTGHKDFDIWVDPFCGTKKAAMRRDFTVNAIMEDILSGEHVDHFGGLDDIRRGILRHVNGESFAEDPLRVLRGAQFAARFGWTVAPETVELCRGMDLTTLSRERIMGELEKALLKADTPSVFFTVLNEMGQLGYWFPEILALQGVEQDPVFHPEGDVWTHTMAALDAAASLRNEAEYPLGFMLSMLLHDVGKTVTSEEINGHIHSYDHEKAGLPIAGAFLSRLTNENKLIRYVLNMVELHGRPNMLAAQNAGKKATMKLFDRSVCPEDLLLVAKADIKGQAYDPANPAKAIRYESRAAYLRERLDLFNEIMARPYVMGRDLIEAGLEPGPLISEALEYSHKLRLAGIPKEDALRQTLGYINSIER